MMSPRFFASLPILAAFAVFNVQAADNASSPAYGSSSNATSSGTNRVPDAAAAQGSESTKAGSRADTSSAGSRPRDSASTGASGGASAGASSGGPDGKAVFDKSCAGCHNAMSPKLSEKDKWAAIMKKGEPAMIASVLKGKGAMPPRGGAPSDDDARAAVKYLETLVK